MNDRNQEVGTTAVIIFGALFFGVILLLAAGILGWLFYRHSKDDLIKAERAAAEARQAQILAIENEATGPSESIETGEVQETVPD